MTARAFRGKLPLQSELQILVRLVFLLIVSTSWSAVSYPASEMGDYVLRDFHFSSGEVLPEVRMHYRAFGAPERDDKGTVRNAVIILHGTTGSSTQFLRPEFAGELFGPGQLLDATRYYIIVPDNLGHGQSSKPSDGLHARFPAYGYRDMIQAQYRLLTEIEEYHWLVRGMQVVVQESLVHQANIFCTQFGEIDGAIYPPARASLAYLDLTVFEHFEQA